VQSIDGGKPRAFTAEGMVRCSVSPTGSILAITDDSQALLYRTTSGGEPETKFKIEPGEREAGWTSDGRSLYLVENQQTPLIINRFEIESGRRSLWKQVVLPSSEHDIRCEKLVITPDGQSYAYTFSNHSSDLYVVAGLK
jgi:hypothetical protein